MSEYITPSTNQFNNQSINHSINQSINQIIIGRKERKQAKMKKKEIKAKDDDCPSDRQRRRH